VTIETAVLLWLYGWGVVLMAGLNKHVETESGEAAPSARWIGAMFWPVVVPFAFARRAMINFSN
jgi:hypothetical protein